jgi:hypothetical protein
MLEENKSFLLSIPGKHVLVFALYEAVQKEVIQALI